MDACQAHKDAERHPITCAWLHAHALKPKTLPSQPLGLLRLLVIRHRRTNYRPLLECTRHVSCRVCSCAALPGQHRQQWSTSRRDAELWVAVQACCRPWRRAGHRNHAEDNLLQSHKALKVQYHFYPAHAGMLQLLMHLSMGMSRLTTVYWHTITNLDWRPTRLTATDW